MNEIDKFGMETVDAILNLVRANYYPQALVLLYSAIDTLAWANLPSGDVTGQDFCQWVDQYMDPQSNLGCTAADLYAARCALLHSRATESRLSRSGRANELWYVTSPYRLAKLRTYINKTGASAKPIYFTKLVSAFSDAVITFSEELATDEERWRVASERLQRWLRFFASAYLDEIGGENEDT